MLGSFGCQAFFYFFAAGKPFLPGTKGELEEVDKFLHEFNVPRGIFVLCQPNFPTRYFPLARYRLSRAIAYTAVRIYGTIVPYIRTVFYDYSVMGARVIAFCNSLSATR